MGRRRNPTTPKASGDRSSPNKRKDATPDKGVVNQREAAISPPSPSQRADSQPSADESAVSEPAVGQSEKQITADLPTTESQPVPDTLPGLPSPADFYKFQDFVTKALCEIRVALDKSINQQDGLLERVVTVERKQAEVIQSAELSDLEIILIIRNPKDVVVSHFHFHKLLKEVGNFEDMQFEDFLEASCDPVTMPYGSWFTNVKNWLRHRDDPNVLTVFYEDLKKDLVDGVTTVAEFIGRPVSGDRAAEIAQLCGFTSMKTSGNMEKSFLRKGVIGDWKNHFNVAQSEMFDDVIEREMAGWDLPLQFE